MYPAKLLNDNKLFQRTASWLDSDLDKDNLADGLSRILSLGSSAYIGATNIGRLERLCFMEFEALNHLDNKINYPIACSSEKLTELQIQISPVLSALRIMQDVINNLIAYKYPGQLPISINDTIKKLDAYKIPEELKSLLKNYWASIGSDIRDYRVIDQHYGSLVSQAYYIPDDKITVLFPDNPQETSKKKWTYKKKICGIDIVISGFLQTHKLIEDIAAFFSYNPSEHEQYIEGVLDADPAETPEKIILAVIDKTEIIDNSMNVTLNILRAQNKENGEKKGEKYRITGMGIGTKERSYNQKK